MSSEIIVQLTSALLWLVLVLSLPVVVVASVVGIVISLLQALTQVQDQTVPFLIKLLAVSITLVLTYRWMGDTILNYANSTFDQIVRMR
jgi:type III secretion protein S